MARATLWTCGEFAFDLNTPVFMGILNVTPDSFSDGGQHDALPDAVAHARALVEQGAHIVDVGGESTRPGSAEVSIQEELRRVVPVVRELAGAGMAVSVDTRHAEVAAAALDAGACIINDVSGMRDPAMREVVANSTCGVVVMHMLGEPGTMQDDPRYTDVVEEVERSLLEAAATLEGMGVDSSRICIDPGPGFGKTFAHNQALVQATSRLARHGYPYMVAVSRKSYIGQASGIDVAAKRDAASALCTAYALFHGASIARVHNVAETLNTVRNSHRAYVALGSNISAEDVDTAHVDGRVVQLDRAVAALRRAPGIWVGAVSSYYETQPAYYESQDRFANAMVELQTTLGPHELLDVLHEIEDAQGRARSIANGPRTLDLDIVDYEGVVCDDADLLLPHPRVLERDFVVTPLLELAPTCVLADGTPVARDEVRYGTVLGVLYFDESQRISSKTSQDTVL